MLDTIETPRGLIGAIAVVNERTLVFGYRDRKGIDLLDIMDDSESALQTLGRYLNLGTTTATPPPPPPPPPLLRLIFYYDNYKSQIKKKSPTAVAQWVFIFEKPLIISFISFTHSFGLFQIKLPGPLVYLNLNTYIVYYMSDSGS